jgi:hypothetical protein
MTDFQKALETTIHGLNTAFKTADADLHEVVASAGLAVTRITDGKGTLQLVPKSEDEADIRYQLVLSDSENELSLYEVIVSTRGYPLQIGHFRIANKQELSRVFEEMASNPDSPLVRKLAFWIRRSSVAHNAS